MKNYVDITKELITPQDVKEFFIDRSVLPCHVLDNIINDITFILNENCLDRLKSDIYCFKHRRYFNEKETSNNYRSEG